MPQQRANRILRAFQLYVLRESEEGPECASGLKQRLDDNLRRAVDLASEKGASSWLTPLPRGEFGFILHKGTCRYALALRYGWLPSHTPTHCDCGSNFSIDHCLSCPKGGFPSLRHNEVRDLTARLLTEVCHDVRVEPNLQPITGETLSRATSNTQDGARLDIVASGFWGGRSERSFFDVRVFKPHAHSNSCLPLCIPTITANTTKKNKIKLCNSTYRSRVMALYSYRTAARSS